MAYKYIEEFQFLNKNIMKCKRIHKYKKIKSDYCNS